MNKSDIKIIFTDLDWTLFDHNQLKYIDSGLQALQKARENGVKVIICTARCYSSMTRVDAFKKIPHDGYICSGGGVAYADNQYIYRHHLDNEMVKTLIQEFKKRNMVSQLISYNQAFLTDEENDIAKIYYDNWLEYRPTVKEYNEEEITSILLFAKEGEEEFLKNYPVTTFRFFEFGLDIIPCPYIKSEGVKAILNHYGFKKEEAAAFGDDIADIEMFNEVKYGVALGNGKQELKDKAYLVTDHLADNGLEHALKKLKVIE
ncbi:MAG: HAD family hydrolase [Bacilli bacterium]|nr:HAD family hydrolase [Bacilli bacterium]